MAKLNVGHEVRRALQRLDNANKLYGQLPADVRALVFPMAYAVECAKNRLAYLSGEYKKQAMP